MNIDIFTFITEGSADYADFLKITGDKLSSGKHTINWKCINSGADRIPEGFKCEGKAEFNPQSHPSHRHATAIHKALKHIESDIVIFVDADIAFMCEGWDDIIVEKLKDVSFFGFEYGSVGRYKNFPCLTFFCFRRDVVDKINMSFYPGPWEESRGKQILKCRSASKEEAAFLGMSEGDIVKCDTGWSIPIEANRAGLTSETMQRVRVSSEKSSLAYGKPPKNNNLMSEWHHEGKPFATHLEGSRYEILSHGAGSSWRNRVARYIGGDVSDSWHINKKEAYRTNYVIATWHGRRISASPYFDTYNKHMIELHIEALSKLKTNLDQITIAVPSGQESDEYFDYLTYLHSINEVNGVPVEVMFRKNKHLSYGGWRDAVLQNDDFDYHIFIEDDYVPVRDNFDSILVDLFRESCFNGANCGFMCGLNTHKGNDHAAISNGITSSAVLGKVNKNNWTGQMEFSRSFQKAGFYIDDWRGHYRSPYYRSSDKTLQEFVLDKSEYLIVPYQLIEAHNAIRLGAK